MFRRNYSDSYAELQTVRAETKNEVRTIVFYSFLGDFFTKIDRRRFIRRTSNLSCLSLGRSEDHDAGLDAWKA